MSRILSSSIIVLALCAAVAPATAQDRGPIFETAFVIEHSVTRTDADGTTFTTEPVTDTYGGSWIVSERADGSRLVIDFARREITEIRPAEGRYSVIGFDRMAQLLRDLRALEGGAPGPETTDNEAKSRPSLRVEEIEESNYAPLKRRGGAKGLDDRPGLRHLRVLRQDAAGDDGEALLDAWFDPGLRLSVRALDVLDEFEREVLGATAGPSARSGQESIALARREAGGSFPIHTLRPIAAGEGTVEDAAQRAEVIGSMPPDLVAVPEGLRRTLHPLELMVAHAESEAELNARMGGGGR